MTRLGIRRRLLGAAFGCGALALAPGLPALAAPRLSLAQARARLQALELQAGGRLGVCALDTGTGLSLGWREQERFGLCSTFKLPLAALVLQAHAAGRIDGHAPIALQRTDLVPHAPVVEAALAAGRGNLSALELAHATQTTSDNVAANLLLRLFGGPEGFTAALRAIGEDTLRIDRWEPQMNMVPGGEVRDTSTPRAMAVLTTRLLGPGLLDASCQRMLAHWMRETRTGLKRLRAGLPESWRAGDKTGTGVAPGMANKHNDVAVAWPPGRPPVAIAAYYEADGHYPQTRAKDDAVLAEVGRLVAEWLG
jgi:beta-lactamase class A